MSDAQATTPGALKGGVTAKHPAPDVIPLRVAPTTGTDTNTFRERLIPVACWKVNDVRFDFDSSFVLPESRSEFVELSQLRKDHPGALLSLFGHADPVGDDVYNKRLSGQRAEAIYAVLIREVDRWEKLYKNGTQGDDWGYRAIQTMVKTVGEDPGPITGSFNPQSKKAVEEFQKKNGLIVDGDAGPKTRAKLFAAYMDFLCPDRLQKTDFLARGADPGGKGDFQGCSEFNPVMVFSKQENIELSKPENKPKRNEENGENRRVMALLFRPGSKIVPAKWPCPRASDGVAACKERFWSDGEKRRSNQADRRTFAESKDTFACRFYHRLVISSPCESYVSGMGWINITLLDSEHLARPDVPYVLTVGGSVFNKRTDGKGRIQHLVPLTSNQAVLDVDRMRYSISIQQLPPVEQTLGLQLRLKNLGYDCGSADGTMNDETRRSISQFQELHKLDVTGEPNSATQAKVRSVYGQ